MKHVLITWGNKWIGLETTKLFLEKGCRVTIVARDFSSFSLKDENLTTISYDLSDIKNIPELVNKVWSIDTLVNNAGIMFGTGYQNYTAEEKEMTLKVNLEAPIALIENCFALNNNLRVVNLSSIAGQIGHPDIWYGITKAGIINITKSYAKSMGPSGAIINTIAPGPVKTDMLASIPQARKDALKSTTICWDFATPVDIAQTILWLGSDSPAYINWFCIDLNNGMFPR